MAGIHYTIKNNRLKKAGMFGVELQDDGQLYLTQETQRHIYFPVIDSAENDARWGRLSFETDITESMVVYTYAVAINEDKMGITSDAPSISDILCSDTTLDKEKKQMLLNAGAIRSVDKDDILLYDLEGRYLYICMDIIGEGEGTISHISIDRQGDNFMDTFPAIYQERGSFFHRFKSVFSSIYNDFEAEIDELPRLLDPDTAPVELLPIYGQWLGLDLSGDFLSEEMLRCFVREGYKLNRMKGTRACLERVIEIVMGERAIILEQNTIKSYLEDGEISDLNLQDGSIFDVNILIKKRLSDTDRHQLLHLIRQFVPLRSRIHLIRLKDSGILDTDIYLDMNAVLSDESYGVFDEDMEFDDDVILEE